MKRFILISITTLFIFGIYSCKKETKPPQEGEVRIMYQGPMHPQVIQEKPGKCPICGMDLVPKKMVYKNGKWVPFEEEMEEGEMKMEGMEMKGEHEMKMPPGLTKINIPVERQYLIGVKTEIVKKKKPVKRIRTYGKVEYSEDKIYAINLKFGGWIEKLYVDYEGKFIKKGEKLFDIYSPELYQTQEELILAYERDDKVLFENVKRKLILWGIREFQIKKILENKKAQEILSFYSPYSGFVIEKKIFEGMKVNPGMNLYKIADLSEVWVIADIYEYELPFIKRGLKAEVEVPYIPGEKFKGYIDYVYPDLDIKTRTAKVRIALKNPSFKLKPGMYVNVNINISSDEEKIIIPVDAILFSGKYNYVFVKKGKGTFEPRVIELGPKVDDGYIVLKGLSEGEEIVTSGNFLIDSESKIQAALKGISIHQH